MPKSGGGPRSMRPGSEQSTFPRLAPPRLAKAPAVAAAPKAKRVAQVAAVASLALLAPQPASASHLADVVSAKLRASGFADAWIVATIAAMPVVELRGAIPVGAMMGMPLPKVFLLCVAGNMVPIAPLLLAPLLTLCAALSRRLTPEQLRQYLAPPARRQADVTCTQ